MFTFCSEKNYLLKKVNMKKTNEKWNDIKGFEGYYQVSTTRQSKITWTEMLNVHQS